MSGLVFKYGAYSHNAGEIYPVSIQVRPLYTDRGMRWAKEVRYTVAGDVLPSDPSSPLSQSDITTRVDALETAYDSDFKDFGFYLADGTTPTSHVLLTDGQYNLSGNRVLAVNFPSRLPSEYANTRSFQATLGALIMDSVSTILYFAESITTKGTGGQKWTYRSRYTGVPVRENIHQKTPVRVTQQGMVVGLGAYPAVPAPWFPADELEDERHIQWDSPRLHGHPSFDRATHYTVKYRYEYMMAEQHNQRPSFWT